MIFKHQLFQELEVEVVATPKGRYYRIHDGTLLPSVTTVLKRMTDQSGLDGMAEAGRNPRGGSNLFHRPPARISDPRRGGKISAE